MPQPDRRLARSENTAEALSLLLRAQRERAGVECLVVADADGLLVACDGPPDACEVLAAHAPLFSRETEIRFDAQLPPEVRVRRFRTMGTELFIAAKGGPGWSAEAATRESATGVARILA